MYFVASVKKKTNHLYQTEQIKLEIWKVLLHVTSKLQLCTDSAKMNSYQDKW